jgi:glycine cleavage system aminomethyltransferase T
MKKRSLDISGAEISQLIFEIAMTWCSGVERDWFIGAAALKEIGFRGCEEITFFNIFVK